MKKRDIQTKIYEALRISPNADIIDSMTISPKLYSILWRPNNYRRQIQVKTKTDSTIQNIESAIFTLVSRGDYTNKKITSIKNFKGVTIQYGRNTLTAIHAQDQRGKVKLTHLIKSDNPEDIDQFIKDKEEEIKTKLDSALKEFSRMFNLTIQFNKPIWSRQEDWLRGDEFIESLPADLIIHDDIGKKVYAKGYEFASGKEQLNRSSIHARNYIRNRAIDKIAPKIVDELEVINRRIDLLDQTLTPAVLEIVETEKRLAVQINLHNDILEGIRAALNKQNINPVNHLTRTPKDIIDQAKSFKDFLKEDFKLMIKNLSMKDKNTLTELALNKFGL